VLKALGLGKEQQKQTFRVGIGRYNTQSEIELALEKIVNLAKKLRDGS
jgi:cysteine desulfurase